MKELRKLQLEQLEILKEIHKVCELLDIKYILSSGTALGAIRHKGFIPWDDDIDIAMLRCDYDKFIRYSQEVLESKYFVQTYKTDSKYPNTFAKVRNSNTTMIEELTKSIDMNKGIYVDIFPIDKVSENKIIRKLDNYRLSIIHLVKYSAIKEYCENASSKLNKLTRKVIRPISIMIGTNRLCRVEEKILIKHNYSDSKLTYAERSSSEPAHRFKESYLFDLDIFMNLKRVDFEENSFYIVEDFEKYLSTYYGDYMKLPSEENRVAHHKIIKLDFYNTYMNYKEE